MTYANRTKVSSDRTQAAIQRLLIAAGAIEFAVGWTAAYATVTFQLADRRILIRLPLPDRNDKAFTHTPVTRERRSPTAAAQAYEQATRAKWRALLLILKAKLEAVAAGVTTIDQEFLPHILLPDGSTTGDHVIPAIVQAYSTGQMPALPPAPSK